MLTYILNATLILGKYMVTHNDETFDLFIWDLSIATELSAELTNIQNGDPNGHNSDKNQLLPLIKTFDYPSDCRTIQLSGHKDEVHCVRFLLPLLISGSADKTIRIWKLPELPFYDNGVDNTKQSGICLRILTGKSSHLQRINHF